MCCHVAAVNTYWGLRDYGVPGQLGLERTPDLYVERMVDVFRAVDRVLRPDGTLWLNLGDAYTDSGRGDDIGSTLQGTRRNQRESRVTRIRENAQTGLQRKQLLMMPARVALALQADGWWLRSDIVWAKPNPMPESVKDRPTKAHEYVFLLSKSPRYYYDAAAIAEESVDPVGSASRYGYAFSGRPGLVMPDGRAQQIAPKGMRDFNPTRNARTVWEIATQPYPEAHFATFPEELARRCILAGSRPGDTVLDPFGGSGTVAQVATGNGRDSIYIDLNPRYLELAKQRIGPMLCDVAA